MSLFKKKYYCNTPQKTDNGYGTSCWYYGINWGSIDVTEFCTCPHHKEVLRISKKKDPFRKFKIFLKFDWITTAYGSSYKGPVWNCPSLSNCYKNVGSIKHIRKLKLQKINGNPNL
jgi:hypothetical protein